MRTKKPGRLTKALLETADDMRRAGVMDAPTHAKITLRHLGDTADVVAEPISGPEIRKLRQDAHLSLRPQSQPHGRLRVATGAGRQAAERSRARFAQCHPPHGHWSDFVNAASLKPTIPALMRAVPRHDMKRFYSAEVNAHALDVSSGNGRAKST